MGCDIHAMIEKKTRYGYINCGDPEIDRNYELFSVLANVRNYDSVPFISDPRGIPNDVCREFLCWYEWLDEDAHSASWVTLKELKDFDISQEYYDSRLILEKDGEKILSVCRGTSGEHFGPVGNTAIFGLFGDDHWKALINKMEKISNGNDEDVRLVFFFDN